MNQRFLPYTISNKEPTFAFGTLAHRKARIESLGAPSKLPQLDDKDPGQANACLHMGTSL